LKRPIVMGEVGGVSTSPTKKKWRHLQKYFCHLPPVALAGAFRILYGLRLGMVVPPSDEAATIDANKHVASFLIKGDNKPQLLVAGNVGPEGLVGRVVGKVRVNKVPMAKFSREGVLDIAIDGVISIPVGVSDLKKARRQYLMVFRIVIIALWIGWGNREIAICPQAGRDVVCQLIRLVHITYLDNIKAYDSRFGNTTSPKVEPEVETSEHWKIRVL